MALYEGTDFRTVSHSQTRLSITMCGTMGPCSKWTAILSDSLDPDGADGVVELDAVAGEEGGADKGFFRTRE